MIFQILAANGTTADTQTAVRDQERLRQTLTGLGGASIGQGPARRKYTILVYADQQPPQGRITLKALPGGLGDPALPNEVCRGEIYDEGALTPVAAVRGT